MAVDHSRVDAGPIPLDLLSVLLAVPSRPERTELFHPILSSTLFSPLDVQARVDGFPDDDVLSTPALDLVSLSWPRLRSIAFTACWPEWWLHHESDLQLIRCRSPTQPPLLFIFHAPPPNAGQVAPNYIRNLPSVLGIMRTEWPFLLASNGTGSTLR